MFGTRFRWLHFIIAINLLCLITAGVMFDFFLLINLVYHVNFLVLPSIVILEMVWRVLKRKTKGRGVWLRLALAFILPFVYIYASHVEPDQWEQKEITIYSDKVTAPMVIVHLSDIQSDLIDEYETEVFQAVADLDPDLLIHTGDLIQVCHSEDYEDELLKLAALFKSIDAPKFHVNGDTDPPEILDYVGFDDLSTVKTLNNEATVVSLPQGSIEVFGLTLRESRFNEGDYLDQFLNQPTDSHFQILIGHAPDYVLHLENKPVDLCLAGHTHGGQVRLPGIGPLLTLSEVPKDWARGFTELGNTRLNVSAGIGAEHAACLPSIRFNCPPEFTVIRILPAP